MDWKPSVCWQLPIRVDWEPIDGGREQATLRRWSRADWGDEGESMAWCCTEGGAYVGDRPVIDALADELAGVVGPRWWSSCGVGWTPADRPASRPGRSGRGRPQPPGGPGPGGRARRREHPATGGVELAVEDRGVGDVERIDAAASTQGRPRPDPLEERACRPC